MQVPEKLSLIGGSILLASTLVFTLKSQASNILPKVDSGVSSLVNADKSGQSSSDSPQNQQDQQKQQQAQADQAFNNNFQQSQQKGWQTGQWGSSKYYIDDGNNLHVGSGQLNGSYTNVADINKIKTISLDGSVQAPSDSSYLFADNNNSFIPLSQINGLSNLNTSNATRMDEMFFDDNSLNNLDLSHFDTHNVNTMDSMFYNDGSLSNLDVSHFDTHNVTNMEEMFEDDNSLSNLDLSHFDTSSVTNMDGMFEDDNIHQLSLGSNTKLQDSQSNGNYNSYLRGTYQSNGQTSSLVDSNAHPGTWIKQ